MQNQTHSKKPKLTNLASLRQRKAYKQDFQFAVSNLVELTKALSLAVENLEYIGIPEPNAQTDFYSEVKQFEISLIERALRSVGGSQVKAARLLKMRATTLNTKIKVYKIDLATGINRVPRRPLQRAKIEAGIK